MPESEHDPVRAEIIAIVVQSWVEGFGAEHVRSEIEWMRVHGHPKGADEFQTALEAVLEPYASSEAAHGYVAV